MDPRKENVFRLLVQDVIDRGEPVGSLAMVSAHELDVSPATVRNWFAEFEEEGLIAQPHTSSGRVPTEKGYRYFAERLMNRRTLSKKERSELEQALHELSSDAIRHMKGFAKHVAERCSMAVVVGSGEADTYYTGLTGLLSQPEFQDAHRMLTLGSVLDHMDEILTQVRTRTFSEPTVFIGSECPFGSMCATIVLTLPDGSCIAAIGPQRMAYERVMGYFISAQELFI